jgi:phosphoserine phosphatase RsbU/P
VKGRSHAKPGFLATPAVVPRIHDRWSRIRTGRCASDVAVRPHQDHPATGTAGEPPAGTPAESFPGAAGEPPAGTAGEPPAGSPGETAADGRPPAAPAVPASVEMTDPPRRRNRPCRPVETALVDQRDQDPVERGRLLAVNRYDILDSPPDDSFDRVAAMAARWFDAPVATVTIVDSDRIWFKAAHGIQGATEVGRDPGLCGSAILRDNPTVIPDLLVDPVASSNPMVAGDMGLRFYAGAPIITYDGYRLGTVNVLDFTPRQITQRDVAMLTDLAEVVMDELELRLSALRTLRAERELRTWVERDNAELERFASTLQSTLLPPALPKIPNMELASHYKPASTREVGGDFYDVFPLGDRRWAFFLGDVCGKGAAAATVTSLVRYTLRAAALHNDDPRVVLEELNAALLLDDGHEDRFCTAVYGTVSPVSTGGFDVRIGTGGHPPAYVLRAPAGPRRQRVRQVRCDGMLAGALPEATFASTTVRLRPGDGLLFYTDGLIESRREGTRMLGQDGLEDHLRRLPVGAAAAAGVGAGQVTQSLVELLEGSGGSDDVALLAMRATR